MLTTQQSINSTTPSPPPHSSLPPISIDSPGTPPISPSSQSDLQQSQHSNGEDERQTLLTMNNINSSHFPATIEEQEENGKHRSSLSLPFEQSPTSPSPSLVTNNSITQSNHNGNGNSSGSIGNQATNKATACERSQSDRRKLSVSNIMSFGEQRRRSTSSIFSDMRKMSITNFDSIKSPGIGETSSISYFIDKKGPLSSHKYYVCDSYPWFSQSICVRIIARFVDSFHVVCCVLW